MASKRPSADDGTASGKKVKAASLIGRDGISFLEKLWNGAWPTKDNDGTSSGKEHRVSAEEAASRLFDDLAFKAPQDPQDGSMKAFMEQSLLTWREDNNFQYDLQSVRHLGNDNLNQLAGLRKFLCGPRERPLLPSKFRTANKVVEFPLFSALPTPAHRHLLPGLLGSVVRTYGLKMTHGGRGEFCSFSIEGQQMRTSMESVAAKFVDAPAAAAPFKNLYDKRERSFDVFLTMKDKPPDVHRPLYACLLQSKHERDRQLQADAVQFLLDLGETYQSPLTHTLSAEKCPSTSSSHVVHTLPSEDIRKLCRLAGVACESGDIYDEIRGIALEFLENLLRDQVDGVTHQADGPLVISCDMVLRAAPLKPAIYGFGNRSGLRYIFSNSILKVLQQVCPGGSLSGQSLSIVHDLVVDLIERLGQSTQKVDRGDTPAVAYQTVRQPVLSILSSELMVTLLRETESAPTIELEAGQKLPPPCTEKILEQALHTLLAGQLLMHGKAECAKALDAFSRSGSIDGKLCFSPLLVASAFHVIVGDATTMTEKGAVFLATLVEYICAEVLDLAAKRAEAKTSFYRRDAKPVIDPRHLAQGVGNDAELRELFTGQMMNGGVISHIDSRLLSFAQGKSGAKERKTGALDEFSDEDAGVSLDIDGSHHALPLLDQSEVKERLEAHREEAQNEAYFRRRSRLSDRRHEYFEEYGYDDGPGANSDSDDGERRFGSDNESEYDEEAGRAEVMQELRKEFKKGYGPARIFDVVSPRTQEDRKREFFCALSPAGQVHLKEVRAEPVTAFQRRIDEIRLQQKEATQVFCPDAFMRLMLEKADESKLRANAAGHQVEGRIIFTHEAVLATQLITETYLLGLLKEAYLNGLDAGRYVLLASDVSMARGVRHETAASSSGDPSLAPDCA